MNFQLYVCICVIPLISGYSDTPPLAQPQYNVVRNPAPPQTSGYHGFPPPAPPQYKVAHNPAPSQYNVAHNPAPSQYNVAHNPAAPLASGYHSNPTPAPYQYNVAHNLTPPPQYNVAHNPTPRPQYNGAHNPTYPVASGYHGIPSPVPNPTPPLVHLPANPHRELTTIYEASSLEFTFPSEHEREVALADGRYNPNSVIPIDLDVYTPSTGPPEVFMTIPRFTRGSPYSLARVCNPQSTTGIQLEPYPNYAWHSSYGQNCDGLSSVFRIKIDECNRMWILDSGEIGRNHTCLPQVVVFDIPSQTVVSRYRLPENVFTRNVSRLVTITVDIADPPPRGRCHNAFVYIADPTAFSMIVYDVVNQKSWRVENRYTHPDPQFSTHTIAGESFQLLDGVFGLSVTPSGLGLRRMLYFHSLTHDLQVAVPLHVINNSSNFEQGLSSELDQFVELGRRGIHCSVSEMTPQGYLMCGFFDPIALVGWDIRKPYTAENRVIMAENSETLQFIGGLKVVPNKNGKQEVWMLSNRGQKFFSGTNNFNEINYRIMKCGLDELLLGKPCLPSS